MFQLFVSLAKARGFSYLSILQGIGGFLSVVGIPGVVILEVATIFVYLATRRTTCSSLCVSVFLGLFAASAVPIMHVTGL